MARPTGSSPLVSYPKVEKDQIAWWNRRIDHFYTFMAPWFKAAKTLTDYYNMDEATQREKLSREVMLDGMDPSYRVKANIIFGWIDQNVSSLATFDPTFRAEPQNRLATGREVAVSRVQNEIYQETGQLVQDERVLLDAHLTPYGGAKIGYAFDVERAVSEIEQEIDPNVFTHSDPRQEEGPLYTGIYVTALPQQKHSEHIEHHTRMLQTPGLPSELSAIIKDHIKQHQHFLERPAPDRHALVKWDLPFGRRWEPDSLLIDPNASDGLSDAMWIAFRYYMPLDMVRTDPKFENVEDLQPTSRMLGAPPEDKSFEADDFGLVELFEIWGRNVPVGTGRRIKMFATCATGHDKWLSYNEEWPYESLEDFPAEVLSFHSGIKTWFNKPPLTLAGGDSIQALTNELMDAKLSIIRKQKNLFLYDPRYIDRDEIENILQGEDMEAFEVEDLAESNGKAVLPLAFGDVPTDKRIFADEIMSMLDRTAGTPQPMSSANPESALEAGIVNERASSREDKRAQKFTNFQIRKSDKFWKLITEFKPARLFLIDPSLEDFEITDDLQLARFKFKIDISSAAQARAIERKQWMDLLNLLGGDSLYNKIAQQYGVPPNLASILEKLLQRGFNIHNPEEILPFLRTQSPQAGGVNDQQQVGAAIQQLMNQAAPEEGAGNTNAAQNIAASPNAFTDQGGAGEGQFNAAAQNPVQGEPQ